MIERTSTRTSGFTRLSGTLAITLLAAGSLGLSAKTALANESETLSAAHKQSDLGFNVLREGDAIGHHSIDFTRRGDDLVVDVNIDLEVKFAQLDVIGPVLQRANRLESMGLLVVGTSYQYKDDEDEEEKEEDEKSRDQKGADWEVEQLWIKTSTLSEIGTSTST